MRAPFSISVAAIYLDREAVLDALRTAASRAMTERPDIEQVILFGSFVSGKATPRSDVDLLIVLRHSRHPRRIDRIPEMSRLFDSVPVAVDILPVTREELDQELASGNRFISRALQTGVVLTDAK